MVIKMCYYYALEMHRGVLVTDFPGGTYEHKGNGLGVAEHETSCMSEKHKHNQCL